MHPFLEMILVRVGFVLGVSFVIAGILVLVGVFEREDTVGVPVGNTEIASQRDGTSIRCADCDDLEVVRIIDGDTFVAAGGVRVRLFGVDTPEVGERCSSEAADRLGVLAGFAVKVEPGPRTLDLFGRSLYYLYTQGGDSIDEKLIREGLGVAWTRDGQHRDAMVQMEREARSNQVGCLW